MAVHYTSTIRTIDSNTSARDLNEITTDLHSSARKQRPTSDHLIIFLHGYNNSLHDIKKRTRLIHNKLGSKYVITTAFNWKSSNSTCAYKSDQTSAQESSKHFVDYLEKIRCRQFIKIDIVAHSMGNFLLTKSINVCMERNQLHLFKGCNIISLAADVAYFEYQSAIQTVQKYVSSWTHYYNLLDPALALSNKAQFINYIPLFGDIQSMAGRAGQSHAVNQFVTSINWISPWNGHGYIDDVFAVNAILAPHIVERRKKEDSERAWKDTKWFICKLLIVFFFHFMLWYLEYINFNVKYQDNLYWKYWEEVLNMLGQEIMMKICDKFNFALCHNSNGIMTKYMCHEYLLCTSWIIIMYFYLFLAV